MSIQFAKAPEVRNLRRRLAQTAAKVDEIEKKIAKPKKAAKPLGRPSTGKALFTMRIDADVLAKFRVTGKGYQTRMNDVLKAAKV